MAHDVLYRRARPRTFDDVVGQTSSVQAITRAITEDRLASSILLSGHYGCGKTTIARLIAASVNCLYREEGSANPCGGENPECMTCPGVLEGTANIGNVTEIDGATSRSIDAIRDMIASMDYQVSARRKVYIIDEAHQLTKDAVSALLKTLEEPPPDVMIIMATTDPQRIPSVIRSRLTNYSLSPLDDVDLTALIERSAEKFGIEIQPSDVTAILSRANNSGRDALNILEQWSGGDDSGTERSPVEFLNGMTDAIADSDTAAVILLINERITAGEDAATCLRLLTTHFRNALVAERAPATLTVAGDWREAAEYGAERLGSRTLYPLVNALLAAHRPNGGPDARIMLETALLDVIVRKSKPPAAAGAPQAGGLSDKDVTTIVDAIEKRLAAIVREQVQEALAAGLPMQPVRSVTTESSLDEEADAIQQPLPAPDDDAVGASGAAPFNADEFLRAIRNSVSRRGARLLETYGSLVPSAKDDDACVLVTTNGRRLEDDDWDIADGIMKGLGWELREKVRD